MQFLSLGVSCLHKSLFDSVKDTKHYKKFEIGRDMLLGRSLGAAISKGHWQYKVEASIINHLRDFVPNMEKYKVVQKNSIMYEDRNMEDCDFFNNSFFQLKSL